MLGAVDNGLNFSHYYVVRDAGLGRRHCALDLCAEPRFVCGSVLAGHELRLDGEWNSHAA